MSEMFCKTIKSPFKLLINVSIAFDGEIVIENNYQESVPEKG